MVTEIPLVFSGMVVVCFRLRIKATMTLAFPFLFVLASLSGKSGLQYCRQLTRIETLDWSICDIIFKKVL